MQDKNLPKVKKILQNLAAHAKVKGIRGLAGYLEIPESSLYSWINRNKIGDTGAILKKLPNVRFEWLETGEGEMFSVSQAQAQTISEQLEGFSPEVKLAADYLEVKLRGKTAEERLRFVEEIMEEIRRKYNN